MPQFQRLFKHGNATGVTIPARIVRHLGWRPEDAIVVEELADRSVRVRLAVASDVVPVVNRGPQGPQFVVTPQ